MESFKIVYFSYGFISHEKSLNPDYVISSLSFIYMRDREKKQTSFMLVLFRWIVLGHKYLE